MKKRLIRMKQLTAACKSIDDIVIPDAEQMEAIKQYDPTITEWFRYNDTEPYGLTGRYLYRVDIDSADFEPEVLLGEIYRDIRPGGVFQVVLIIRRITANGNYTNDIICKHRMVTDGKASSAINGLLNEVITYDNKEYKWCSDNDNTFDEAMANSRRVYEENKHQLPVR